MRRAPYWLESPLFCHGFKLAFVLCLAVITWLALSQSPPKLASSLWDKANHFLAFFSLQCLNRLGWPKQSFIRRTAWVLAFGCAIELAQAALPYRTSSLLDILADSLGMLAGEICLATMQYFLKPGPDPDSTRLAKDT